MTTRSRLAIVAGLAALTAVTGCSSGHGAAPAGTTAKAAVAQSSPSPTSATSLGQVLQSVAIQPSDMPIGFTWTLVKHGAEVKGQTTLDGCGYDYTTEANRVARREYEAKVDKQQVGLQNELVAYTTPAAAAAALTQWHESLKHCSTKLIHSKVDGNYYERILSDAVHVSGVPLPRSEATLVKLTTGHTVAYAYLVFQVQGRFLDGVYGFDTEPMKADAQSQVKQYASVTGLRLASHA